MSSIEERLARDISAVSKGVVVTERDLLDARSATDERIDSNRGRGRLRTGAMVAAAAVLVAGVGFGAIRTLSEDNATVTPASGGEPADDAYADSLAGEAPTLQNLNGFWRVDNGVTTVRYQTDGTVQFSDEGAVISDPVTTGTYTIDGDTIAVTALDAPGCVSSAFTMRAALPEPGLMNIVLAEPQFGTCGTVATTIALEHVLPADGYLAEFGSSGEKGWQPVADEAVLHGDWLAEGGGYLLEISEDGTYYVADESADVVDNGEWRLRGSRLELFSRTESPQCEEGDWLVLGNFEYVNTETTWLRGIVDQNDCGGGWTPASWFQIPDATSD